MFESPPTFEKIRKMVRIAVVAETIMIGGQGAQAAEHAPGPNETAAFAVEQYLENASGKPGSVELPSETQKSIETLLGSVSHGTIGSKINVEGGQLEKADVRLDIATPYGKMFFAAERREEIQKGEMIIAPSIEKLLPDDSPLQKLFLVLTPGIRIGVKHGESPKISFSLSGATLGLGEESIRFQLLHREKGGASVDAGIAGKGISVVPRFDLDSKTSLGMLLHVEPNMKKSSALIELTIKP